MLAGFPLLPFDLSCCTFFVISSMDEEKVSSSMDDAIKANEQSLGIQSRALSRQLWALEGEAKKRRELEAKLRSTEDLARQHSSELRKQRTTMMEMVSSQRQLESELGRAIGRAEALREALDEALEEKEAAMLMVEKLSMEIVMLKKSKLESVEEDNLVATVHFFDQRSGYGANDLVPSSIKRLQELVHPKTGEYGTNDFRPPSNHSKKNSIVSIGELYSENSERSLSSSGDRDRNMVPNQLITTQSPKMDIRALGVSYKINRLKQQLLVLESLEASKEPQPSTIKDDETPSDSREEAIVAHSENTRGFFRFLPLLNKQVKRYQSLEAKTEELCMRMQESHRTGSRTSSDEKSESTKERMKMLESFLEETLHLQRYMVATGQKSIDVQSRIARALDCSSDDDDGSDHSTGFNIRRFADIIRTLFTEVQRGLELRIARMIGDLEGTLACDGILHW